MKQIIEKIDKHYNQTLNPDTLQRQASNPHESIWVSASAGSGKTKVLTDRVLRLLLPRSNGLPATKPHKILCLTFTKSAASEMELRIKNTLGHWAIMPDRNDNDTKSSLYHVLKNLLGDAPDNAQILAAKRLFPEVIDATSGLQIMTIHSFCQSLLSRFPLEAGISPNFTMLEEQKNQALLEQAQKYILSNAQNSASEFSKPLQNLSRFLNEDQFTHLIKSVCSERYQLQALLSKNWDHNTIYSKLCAYYDIKNGLEADMHLLEICSALTQEQEAKIKKAAYALLKGSGSSEPTYGQTILEWFNKTTKERMNLYQSYRSVFITSSESIRKKGFPTKKTEDGNLGITEILHKEAQRLIDAEATLKKIYSASGTRDLIHLGIGILKQYQKQKSRKGALDFDDLIIKTLELLTHQEKNFSSWVMYKLDQGLDHILVDEAQDTNPEQWKIIAAICDEFFHGYSARDDVERSCFVVGDLKQSIYSFQRAAPAEFLRMQKFLHEKISQAGKTNRSVALDISFRSTECILRIVDSVFAPENMQHAAGGELVHHTSFREGQAGRIELWPLFKTEKREAPPYWTPPIEKREYESSAAQLSAYIADNIAQWIENKETLPAYDRPINAGDILILVRTRTKLVDQLVRNLKNRNIPVNGADRMILGEHLAVEDLLALGKFALLPDDDLTLACILKSPFLNWSEEELFTLSYKRKKSLWHELNSFDETRLLELAQDTNTTYQVKEKLKKTHMWLSNIIEKSNHNVFEFFSYILNHPCPADQTSGLKAVLSRLGNDAIDPLDEFLNITLNFSKNSIGGLQVFLDQQEHEETEIKRELEDSKSQVRIMTVHASKGLQAPIVILPDTIQNLSSQKYDRLLWPDKTKLNMPIWAANKDLQPQQYETLLEDYKIKQKEENMRLLYVAMTRAADRLYIAGHEGQRSSDDGSWYHLIRRAIEDDSTHEELKNGVLRIENSQTSTPDRKSDQKDAKDKKETLPDWAYKNASFAEETYKVISASHQPSNSEESLSVMISPLKARENNRFKRGNITHKLLQFLPDIPQNKRKDAAILFTNKHAQELSETIQSEIVDEVMRILEHPDYAPFFAEGSLAEVPTTGFSLDQKNIINSQIDRLVIKDDTIWILDYKSNRPPPKTHDKIPEIYRKQIKAYKDIISQIYPDHKINCGLLWTDGPNLMILEKL